ncbi:MAG TPA: GNAT family N-acetyltransferase [Ferruginibacter sp.]|nr:GNAT family N-acetyltransferase [Ferruginibacter sp.]
MILVRTATANDLPAMLVIYNDIIINTTAVYDYEPHTIEMRRQWFTTKQEQGFPVFVAEENGVIVGFSSFGTFRAWTGFNHTVENSIYVSAEHRGKGIGKLLLPPLIDAAKELKLHAIVAGIDATNMVSIKLHEKFGFVEVAHFKEVGYKFDRWLDLVFMELIV